MGFAGRQDNPSRIDVPSFLARIVDMILVRHGQSEFNAAFNRTRIDPGIVDPRLTGEGRAQANAVAVALRDLGIRRLIASPYTRALETAALIAEVLGTPIGVEPLVRERSAFICDIGTPGTELARRWPALRFGHLADPWWTAIEESEDALATRGRSFCEAVGRAVDCDHVAAITHWAFIRALTGLSLANGAWVAFDPEASTARGPVAGLAQAI